MTARSAGEAAFLAWRDELHRDDREFNAGFDTLSPRLQACWHAAARAAISFTSAPMIAGVAIVEPVTPPLPSSEDE